MQDSPVGVGFSYADDPSALVKTDSQGAADLVAVIKVLLKKLPTLRSSPLFLVGESYGGKMAAIVGVSLSRAIREGTITNMMLGGKGR
jgi:serine carboxypeptidase 1